VNRADFLAGSVAALAVRGKRRRRVRFGVNYVPSEKWWYCWGDWNRSSIRRDLDDVAALGADHIRIQLLWPYFQPNARYVSGEHLARLVELLDDAQARNLDVEVTVLDGQLSGFLFTPAFLIDNQDGHVGNIVTDPHWIEVEKRLFSALASEISQHPAFLGFDISNEVYWFTQPLHIAYTPAQGDAWMRELLGYCNRIAPGKLHVNGVDKYPYEDRPSAFTRAALAREGAASCIHPWAGFSDVFPKHGPRSAAATHYAEFWLQYMQAFSATGTRLSWIEEDGCSKAWVEERLIPQWAEASVRSAASCDHLFGITWWCSHDFNPRFTGFNKLEYDLGLYTNDRRLKPLGRTLAALFAEFDRSPPAPIARTHAMVIPDDAGGNDVFERYVSLLKDGIRPQIALKSRADDKPYLRARGIDYALLP
jgi:endo-1,4-beta-mannosidase